MAPRDAPPRGLTREAPVIEKAPVLHGDTVIEDVKNRAPYRVNVVYSQKAVATKPAGWGKGKLMSGC